MCVCLPQVREVFKQIARVKRTEGEMLRLLILDLIKFLMLSQGGFTLSLIQNRGFVLNHHQSFCHSFFFFYITAYVSW